MEWYSHRHVYASVGRSKCGFEPLNIKNEVGHYDISLLIQLSFMEDYIMSFQSAKQRELYLIL